MANELDTLIDFLRRERGVPMADVIAATGLKRDTFYRRKEGGGERQKSEMLEKIKNAFAEEIATQEQENDSEGAAKEVAWRKYVRLLEESLESMRRENARLAQQNEEMWKRVFGQE